MIYTCACIFIKIQIITMVKLKRLKLPLWGSLKKRLGAQWTDCQPEFDNSILLTGKVCIDIRIHAMHSTLQNKN